MPETNQIAQLNEMLNDLVLINFQHVKSLKRFIALLADADRDLVPVLDEMVMQCRRHIDNLMSLDFAKGKEVLENHNNFVPADITAANTGILAKAWFNTDFTVKGSARGEILEASRHVALASLTAYQMALVDPNVQNANPLIQRDLEIQLADFRNELRRLKSLT